MEKRGKRGRKGAYHVLIDRLSWVLDQVRQKQPVVHAITNWVTAADVANALNMVGAKPILAFAQEEVEEVISKADALMLNLGTPTSERVEAMLSAGHRANTLGKRVILDPVGAGASMFRDAAIRRLLSELQVAVIRGNRAEIGRLAGMGGELRGVDAFKDPENLHTAAEELSERTGAVIAMTGEQDLIVGGGQRVIVENGHPLLGRLTGTGCMLTAVIAAFAACEQNPMDATVAAVACFGLAGERAAEKTAGPGTFKGALLDSLFAITPGDFQRGVRIGG
jgi:hydroxyethylthiazole kinase